MLTCLKYLKEAAEKQHTIVEACSGNLGYFLFKYAVLALMGV